ncbi:monoacylglycerol lipase ABHD6 [Zootoca vivipara]|uniref:monoacylglycerol lipase ABHD6 n=1 Tax=Zootoca vivipara TaxID=8524 RepID=UPI00293BF2BD|nr:monoacylglycerol lipase ABHD6 [Zootoca vivipara]
MELSLANIFFKIVSIVGLISALTLVTVYHLLARAKISRIMIWYKRQKRGVAVNYAEHEGYRFCYFCRGEPGRKPSVLILHGLAFNKDIWLNTIKFLPKDLHLVRLDMPGHGETTCLLGDSYAAVDQTKKIHQFVECIGLNQKPFHLVGTSMGGMIAGVYAAQYPSEVSGLSLLCPLGLRYPDDNNDTFKRLREQLIKSRDVFQLGLYHPSTKNTQLLKGYVADWRQQNAFLAKCFFDLSNPKSKFSLHDNMSNISAPTQVLWGKDDQVADSSGAEILAHAIPNSQVHMLERCGHIISFERPRKSAKLLLEFYNSVCDKAENKKLA